MVFSSSSPRSATNPSSAIAPSAHFDSEREQYASEFTELVRTYPPEGNSARPSTWLRRLPKEALAYYRCGIVSYGRPVETPLEKRGRLYLMHSALLFMWMSWDRPTTEQRFRQYTSRGTYRASSLITLELYRRGGVLADFEVEDWFWQPVAEWTVHLKSEATSISKVPNERLAGRLGETSVLSCSVDDFSDLRSYHAVAGLSGLPLASSASATGV
jgi:hypothetical protein